jgi:predicted amidohydrolase YtcJ
VRSSHRVRFGSLKGFVDGVVESNTAAFLEPYADDPKLKGTPHLDADALKKAIVPADRAGFSVSLHAIGDRSVRLALDAYALAAKTNHTKDRRHRVEHIETLDPADIKRFHELGVIASMQPYHAEPADQPGAGVWEVKVGEKRLPHIWAWRELLDSGATLAFGSDWSVVSLDPLFGLAVATSRQNGHGLPIGGWVGKQKLTFAEAVTGYTSGAAYALHAENELGTLAPGRAADLVMLGGKVDINEPLSLYWGSVDLTMIDGEVVYDHQRQVMPNLPPS